LRGIVTADTSDLRGDGSSVSRRAYIQNDIGPWSGIWVAGLAGDELRKGQDVTISGLIREINSHTAIDSVTQLVVNSTNNPEPEAQLLTTGEIGGKAKGTLSAEMWEGVLIKFNNVTVTNTNADGNPGPSGGGNSNFGEVLINDGTGNLRLETQEGPHPYHNNWSTTLPANKTIPLNVGDRFTTVKGILFFSFSNYKIVPRKEDDFVGYQTGVEHEILPDKFVLKQNYPNPFNPSTVIEYNLPEASNVTLKIYDLMGREVKTLVNGEFQTKGLYKYFVYSNDLSSGVYFYQLKTDKYSAVKKMMLIK
ncbi:MAG: T9SS type A sorting domain-containing protein, partial [Ignavibacteria bacterium]